jgi:hypothetical protein
MVPAVLRRVGREPRVPGQSQIRELIGRSYAAFNARDLDAALEGMHPEVDWPNAIDGVSRTFWMSDPAALREAQ